MRIKRILLLSTIIGLVCNVVSFANDPVTLPAPKVLNRYPAVAANTDGNTALVVWESAPDALQTAGAVYASLVTVAVNGNVSLGPVQKISTSSANNGLPVVAFNPDTGTYLVAWSEYNNQAGIWVREIKADGKPDGGAVEIISNFNSETEPRLVYIGGSDDLPFLLVYSRNGSSGQLLLERGIWGVKLDDSGMPVGDEWPILLGDIYTDVFDNKVRSSVDAFDIAAAGGSAHIVSTMFVYNPKNDTTIERGYVTWIKLSKNKTKNGQIKPDSSSYSRIAALGKRWVAVSWIHNDGHNSNYVNQTFRKHKAKSKIFDARPGSENKATALVSIGGGAAMVYTISGPDMFLQKLNAKGKKTGAARSLGKFYVYDLRGALLSNGKQLLIVGVTNFNSPAKVQAFSVQLN